MRADDLRAHLNRIRGLGRERSQSLTGLRIWFLSVAAGALCGLIYRFVIFSTNIGNRLQLPLSLVSLAFLCAVPLVMGYLSVDSYFRSTLPEQVRWYRWFFLPWISVALVTLVSAMIGGEGRICILFASPLLLLFSMLGGMVAFALARKRTMRSAGRFSALVLPLLVLLLEGRISNPDDIRTVETQILIHAPANTVWNNIKSVRGIDPAELPRSWITRAGFPRPIAATLSYEGIGGVRHATFTGGLIFTETINRWKPGLELSFSIRANTDSIPPTTLDEHVRVGGEYFDVLDGQYRLEQRTDGVLLHLSSRERLSTHINPYAGQWTDAVMRSIQNQILIVIRRRSETEAQAGLLH